ncbi:lipoprotein-releasing system ATP-binding protein LolD [Putridiphycobacter roseus]|uniref:Lipoprotein-releasing system ATP-binding protein LolD n=1 Tax=Putridiphycobacter roseus TaxID=2219161 RepID=A0A2W1NT96_9FLAO|nr:ABC transporter ATP-binding protein [Putridiphycobacter roseus]PZE17918.1 lipoprotein-releasing system ATP-binding protein LolD [Putridiphycobacter roseus]
MLEAQNISKNYGDLPILKGIDLTISPSEVVCITGASGAGKTTLLQILGTLDAPDSGKIEILGEDIAKLKGKKLANFRNNHLGFVFQFHQLLPEFSALENVIIPALLGGKKKSESIEKAKSILDFLNIAHRLDHKPSELSGGEQQRIAVARALINDPEIIFADEPSGNLDSKNSDELHELFFKLRDEFGQSFVIVTHNMELAKMADRALVMKDGLML